MNRLLHFIGALAFAVPSGCVSVDEASECHLLKTEKRCEAASIDGQGACHWIDVFVPRVDENGCSIGEPHQMCIGISGTSLGCGLVECEGAGDPSNGPNAYFRIADDGRIEVFDNPECGPTPSGEWEACIEPSDAPPECGCLCPG
jgi:hypothetical protein